MKIRLAGAGAGKTSHLANVIFDEYRMISGTARHIYVISYSNLARNIIFERFQKKFHGNIPRDIFFNNS